MQVMVAKALSKMSQDIHQIKGCQEICGLLAQRVPQSVDVLVEVPQDGRVPDWEAVQSHPQFQQVL